MSRFGWSGRDQDDLRRPGPTQNMFLLHVRPGDWIVHLNCPSQGRCAAAKVVDEYNFDDGLGSPGETDFRHCFGVDKSTVINFERNHPAIVPTVRLGGQGRWWRIYAVQDFERSLENLKTGKPATLEGETVRETHDYLSTVVGLIQKFHPRHKLEAFLAEVFRRVDGVVEVDENGRRWGTDHGADLIVTLRHGTLGHLELQQKIVIQVKSWKDEARDTLGVEQLRVGIERFQADAGMLITTAASTPGLVERAEALSKDLGKPIDVLASTELARFVIKHAPELISPELVFS